MTVLGFVSNDSFKQLPLRKFLFDTFINLLITNTIWNLSPILLILLYI
jgi:hypothetical protein